MEAYEQYEQSRHPWTWVVIIILAVGVMGWAMVVHHCVPDVPRQWDFGQLPDTPGESRYSTRLPPGGPPPLQMQPLPEAQAAPPASPSKLPAGVEPTP